MAFDSQRLVEVIRTDATVAKQADFLATHTPFSCLRYVVSGLNSQNAKQIHEETFLQDIVLNQRDSHQFLVIQGDNGSGKSHFIRWVKERYMNQVDPDKEAVLLITRSQNTLRGALEQIINANIFPPGLEINDLRTLIKAKENLSTAALKQKIAVHFAVSAQNSQVDNCGLKNRHLKRVYAFLTDQTVQEFLNQPGKAIDRIYRRLSDDGTNKRQDDVEPRFLPSDLVVDRKLLDKMNGAEANMNAVRLAEDLFDSEKGLELREKLAQYLNQHLEYVVQSCTSLRSADLKGVFEQLRIALKAVGKTLTLFIEDITSFTGIDRALVEVLVTEHTGSEHNDNFCRLFSVVGVTNDYYQTSFPDNLKERVTGRVFIDQATLNTADELAEMAARYMNAISLSANELEAWVNSGAREENLPIAKTYFNHQWALYKLEDGREISIFPFNVHALEIMYNNLPVKTPRRFLQDIIRHVVSMFINYGAAEFPPPLTEFEGEFKIPTMMNPLHDQIAKQQGGQNGERISMLLRLWGDGTVNCVEQSGVTTVGGLTQEVYNSFKLPFITGVAGDAPVIENPKTPKPEPKPGSGSTAITTPPEPPKPKEPQLTKEQEQFKKLQDELEAWLDKNGKLKSHRQLRDDLLKLLLEYIDWDAEGISAPVVNAFLNSQRLSIEGQTGIVYKGFKITRNIETQRALLAIGAWHVLGNKSWDFESSTDYLISLYNWLTKIKFEVVSYLRAPEGVNATSWDLPGMALMAHFYVQAFNGNNIGEGLTDDIYNSIFQPTEPLKTQEHRSDNWHALQVRLKQADTVINNNHNLLKRYYNRMQGSITGTTEVYFIDAVPLLKLIKTYKKQKWDLASVDLDLLKNKEDLLWYWPLKVIDTLHNLAKNAQESEVTEAKKLLTTLEEYIGTSPTNKELNELFNEMTNFLTKVLPEASEAYTSKNFVCLTDKLPPTNKLTAAKFQRRLQSLNNAVQEEGIKQLLLFAKHPIEGVHPYLQLFNNMDALLDNKIAKFTGKLDNLTGKGTEGVSDIISKAEGHLKTLKDAFTNINQDQEDESC